MNLMPFGADTLVIPLEMSGGSAAPRRVARMSRMRPAGELFRNGVVRTAPGSRDEDGLLVPVQSRRRGGGGLTRLPGGVWRELSAADELLLVRFNRAMEIIRRSEPYHRDAQYMASPDWMPKEPLVDRLEQEAIAIQDRARLGLSAVRPRAEDSGNAQPGLTPESLADASAAGRRTRGHSILYERVGGKSAAMADFEALMPMNVRTANSNPDVTVGDLRDGRTVTVRSQSRDGRPTLEIYDPTTKRSVRYRYN